MALSSDRCDFDPQSPAREDTKIHAEGVGRYFAELKEYASYYASAKWDGVKLSIRQVVLYAALGILALCVAGAVLVMAVVLLLNGIAGGLGVLFGHHPWLGNLVLGAVLLGLVFAGAAFGLKFIANKSKHKTVQKYESRKRQQRDEYGRDVRRRSHQARS